MFEFDFEVAGEEQVRRRFSRFGKNIDNLTPAFKEIRGSFYEGEQKQFATEGGWGSGGWKALSPDYAARKAKKYPGRPIMELSGALMASLTRAGAEGSIALIFPTSLTLGTHLPYAIYHQSKKPRTTGLPRRPLIELPEVERKKWTSIIHSHLWRNQ